MQQQINQTNTSGQGKTALVPEEIAKEFNWGAFLLSWIWGIGNGTYITLLVFLTVLVAGIPFVGLIVQLALVIWFGKMGNTWAWQNKRFESVEHFKAVQKKWVIAGLIVFVITVVLSVAVIILPAMAAGFAHGYNSVQH